MSNKSDTLTGKTREQVLERLGLEDTDQSVVVVEDSGWSGGCETCAFWYEDMWIEVDGEKVYNFYSGHTSLAAFLAFLSGDDGQGYTNRRD